MACAQPALAYREDSGRVRFAGRGQDILKRAQSTPKGAPMEVPCGHCVGCRLDRRRAWSIRCMHEAQLYDSNLFVTWTYDDGHLPESRSLEYVDFQLMMKRLRKEVRGVSKAPDGKFPIRFFCSGEYGGLHGRPHWHALLFNARFNDMRPMDNGKFLSRQAETLWGKGTVCIGTVTPRSAAYVAGYTLEKVYGSAEAYEDVVDLRTGELTSRRPEFCNMSRRPGIGAWWFDRYRSDLFGKDGSHDFAVMDGVKYKVPRYYVDQLEGNALEAVKEARFLRAMEVPVGENSERRRRDREEVAIRQLEALTNRRVARRETLRDFRSEDA